MKDSSDTALMLRGALDGHVTRNVGALSVAGTSGRRIARPGLEGSRYARAKTCRRESIAR